jgi:glycosyltransferase involved in cell wall biosynthesis
MFEYLSLGRPIIASDLEQLAEIVHPAIKISSHSSGKHDQAVGLLVSPHDIQGFIKAGIFLIDEQQELIDSIGSNARTKAITHYSWNNHVRSIINFYTGKVV